MAQPRPRRVGIIEAIGIDRTMPWLMRVNLPAPTTVDILLKILSLLCILGGFILGFVYIDRRLGETGIVLIVSGIVWGIFLWGFAELVKNTRLTAERLAAERSRKTDSSDNEDTKECPSCAETIKSKAVLCRFCNRNQA